LTANKPLVLVPGLSGRADVDFPFLAPMLRRRFDVVEVTLAGAGGMGLPGLVERVASVVSDCDSPPLLVGYSLGAVVAASVASAPSAQLAGLVLVAGWWNPSPKLVNFASNWARLRAEGSTALDGVVRQSMYSAAGWDSAHSLPADETTDELIALAATCDLSASDPFIDHATLVIGCADDEVATARESRLLFGAIADSRYAEVASGHGVTHERPAELIDLIDSFAAEPQRLPAGSIIVEQSP
jgi:pimeloyl-ACP methyl ester carboxylesterase